jgi:ribosomal-protein-alanine N-acetyltransferase
MAPRRTVCGNKVHQIPEIETERLRLRAFRADDAQDVFAYARNPNVLRYTTGTTPTVLAETQKFVDGLVNKPAGAFAWAIRLKTSPRVIGAVEFGIPDGATGSIDYALAEERWNQGIMTEAARAVLDWAFRTHSDLQAVTTAAMTVNIASIRVLQKCGMKFQRYEQQKWEKFADPVDLAVYSVSRQMWSSQ